MNADLLDGLARVADSSESVPQLRRLVVALAISGKLDTSGDEDAFTLMRELLKEERERLVKMGKLKRQGELPSVSSDELPFEISTPCHFERLGNLAMLAKGLTGIQSAVPGPFPLVVTAEDRSSCDHFDFDGAAAIVPMVSSAGHGKASIKRLHYQEGKFALGNILCAVFPISDDLISARFLYEYLTAFKEDLLVTRMIGTANVSLTFGKIAEVPVPLLSRRIQQRVDELMALCDRLEVAQREREGRRDRLVASSLNRLNNGADADAFRDHARFYFNHLPRLTTRTEHIHQLRQTILNLAVRGKLVPQDPYDESAIVLLKRLTARWVEDVAKDWCTPGKSVDDFSSDAFEVPNTWIWTKLGACVESMSNGIYKPAKFYSETGTACVRMFNIRDGCLDLSKLKRLDLSAEETEHYRLEPGDLLVNRVNSRELVGKCAVVTANDEPLVFEAMNIRVRLIERQQMPHYINLALRTDRIRALFRAAAKQAVGQASVNQSQVANIAIPLPPLAEQQRIVAKVDELMALCDKLETQLTTTQTESRRLLEAVLRQALTA